jgi:hypothetical protein
MGFCVLQTPLYPLFYPLYSLLMGASVDGRAHASSRSAARQSIPINYNYLPHRSSDWNKFALISYSVSVPKRKKKGASIMWLLKCDWSNPARNAWLNRQVFLSARLTARPGSLKPVRAGDSGLFSIGCTARALAAPTRGSLPPVSCSASTRPASPERPEHLHQVFSVAASHRSGPCLKGVINHVSVHQSVGGPFARS